MSRSDPSFTEFPFILPRGLIDDRQRVHCKGAMRLATARDEIEVQRTSCGQEHPAYGFLVMLSRVILRLGNLTTVSPALLERLTLRDLAYLRQFYNQINDQGSTHIPTECPHCQSRFSVELQLAGEP